MYRMKTTSVVDVWDAAFANDYYIMSLLLVAFQKLGFFFLSASTVHLLDERWSY